MHETADQTAALIRLSHEAGHLKNVPRTGWLRAGVRMPESVAEHSWRVSVLAYFIAHAEGADAEHAAVLGMFHDLAEVRTGDVDWVGRNYVAKVDDSMVVRDQAAGLAPVQFEGVTEAVCEHAAAETPEALCARDADKLECLLQGREYEQQGYPLARGWVETMLAAVRTPTGKALAEVALAADPAEWWRQVSS
jgi:putative hydrolase of HD superfamily